METLVDGDLIKLLGERGITVDYTFNNLKRDHDGRTWEIDILAANGTEVVVVEVKPPSRYAMSIASCRRWATSIG